MPLLIKSESVKMQPTKSYPHVVQLGLVLSMELGRCQNGVLVDLQMALSIYL